MAEEFLESDVVFSDHHHHDHTNYLNAELAAAAVKEENSPRQRNSAAEKKKKAVARSVPVNIPERMMVAARSYEEEAAEMVPPHVMMGRRMAGKMAYSVCTGQGRTLKGRDLSRVRNSVLRMTGFLEA